MCRCHGTVHHQRGICPYCKSIIKPFLNEEIMQDVMQGIVNDLEEVKDDLFPQILQSFIVLRLLRNSLNYSFWPTYKREVLVIRIQGGERKTNKWSPTLYPKLRTLSYTKTQKALLGLGSFRKFSHKMLWIWKSSWMENHK